MNTDIQQMSLNDIKKIELAILRYVAGICKDNNLSYFLAYGTLIGAIRHKGFIPWDDDIDIAMPRKDYEKLLDILNSKENQSQYKCLIPLKDNYFYEFAKVIDITTIVQEGKTIEPRCGVWIDIFPLDGLRKEDKRIHRMLAILNRCRAASVNSHFPHKTKGLFVPFEFLFWKACKIIGYKPFLKKSLALSKKYEYEDCDYVGYASSYPPNRKYMKKEWFSEAVDVEFEGFLFRAPAGYHEYLSTEYGNYMMLPPEEKRVSHRIVAYKIGK